MIKAQVSKEGATTKTLNYFFLRYSKYQNKLQSAIKLLRIESKRGRKMTQIMGEEDSSGEFKFFFVLETFLMIIKQKENIFGMT